MRDGPVGKNVSGLRRWLGDGRIEANEVEQRPRDHDAHRRGEHAVDQRNTHPSPEDAAGLSALARPVEFGGEHLHADHQPHTETEHHADRQPAVEHEAEALRARSGASRIASVNPISMNDARDIATGTESRTRSIMSLGLAQAGKRAAVMGVSKTGGR